MKRRKKYNKLVRDKIPSIIMRRGGRPITRAANDKEYWDKLIEKLQEEVAEFADSEATEELADVLEVLDAVTDYKGFTKKEIETEKRNKAKRAGRFEKRIILIEAEALARMFTDTIHSAICPVIQPRTRR